MSESTETTDRDEDEQETERHMRKLNYRNPCEEKQSFTEATKIHRGGVPCAECEEFGQPNKMLEHCASPTCS